MSFKNRLFAASMIFTAFPSLCLAGANSSGGGYACYLAGNTPVLLDLVNQDLSFRDPRTNPPLVLGKIGNVLGYEVHAAKELPAYQLATQRIQIWEKSSPFITGLLKESLSNLEWRFTAFNVSQGDETYVALSDVKKSCSMISPVVLYTNLLGALTNVNAWNSLGQTSQAALLIHEGLRRVQLHYSENESTEKLQKLTATIMLSEPGGIPTLDSQEYMSGSLLNAVQMQDDMNSRQSSLFKEVCEFAKTAALIQSPSGAFSYCMSSDTLPAANAGPDEMYQFDSAMYKDMIGVVDSTMELSRLTDANLIIGKLDDLLTDENRRALQANTSRFLDIGDQIDQPGQLLHVGEDAIFTYILTGKADSHASASQIRKTIKLVHKTLELSNVQYRL